jgi:hypothetical protein
MSSSTKTSDKIRAIGLKVSRDHLQVLLEDGRIVVVPLQWYPRLAHATPSALKKYEWIGKGLGIHWPELDEDLSVEGFLKGWKAPAKQFAKKRAKTKFLTDTQIGLNIAAGAQ